MTPKISPVTINQETFENLVDQISHIVQTLYIGNGQEPVLPRLARIETALTDAATTTKETANELAETTRENAAVIASIQRQTAIDIKEMERLLISNISDLSKEVGTLANSVRKHHETIHLSDLLKTARFWTITFFSFLVFHSVSSWIDINAGGWVSVITTAFLKYIGAK